MSELESTNGSTLESLLEADLDFDATTVEGLTNHLPMALVAKAALGATPDELRRYFSRYERRLRRISSSDRALETATWRRAIGIPAAFPNLVDYFFTQVRERGASETLHTHVPEVVPGVYGAAFHGVIRLAYALESESDRQIASGLAYLAASASSIGTRPAMAPSTDQPLEVMDQIASRRSEISPGDRHLISDQMADVASREVFWDLAGSCSVDEGTFDLLRDAALRLYATREDFISLHAVTGLEALSSLRPFAVETSKFDEACLVGLLAAYAAAGAPRIAPRPDFPGFLDGGAIGRTLVADVGATSNDEHVSKLIYSALRLFDVTGDELYVAVAARKAGLGDLQGVNAE